MHVISYMRKFNILLYYNYNKQKNAINKQSPPSTFHIKTPECLICKASVQKVQFYLSRILVLTRFFYTI